jgi:hypothetical protein
MAEARGRAAEGGIHRGQAGRDDHDHDRERERRLSEDQRPEARADPEVVARDEDPDRQHELGHHQRGEEDRAQRAPADP